MQIHAYAASVTFSSLPCDTWFGTSYTQTIFFWFYYSLLNIFDTHSDPYLHTPTYSLRLVCNLEEMTHLLGCYPSVDTTIYWHTCMHIHPKSILAFAVRFVVVLPPIFMVISLSSISFDLRVYTTQLRSWFNEGATHRRLPRRPNSRRF